MGWSTFVIQGMHGLVYGMLLFLVASGLTLVFGMMNVLNIAHVAFYMLAAYFSYEILQQIGNFWVGLIVCPLLVGLLGILLERFLLRKVHVGGHVREFVIGFGVLYVINEAVKWIWGTQDLPVPVPNLLAGSVMIAGNVYPIFRLFILIFSLIVLAFLAILLMKTRLGIIVRASVSDRDMVGMLGINTPRVFMLVMGIGSWLAGLAGVIAGPFISTYPGMASEILVDCFIVTVSGGLGSLMGAVVASFIIGQLSSFGIIFIPRFAIVFAFLFMAVVLIIKPSGLFGEKGFAAPAAGGGVQAGARLGGGRGKIVLGILGLLLLLCPLLLPRFQLRMVNEIIILTLFAMTWKMMLNEGGMFSFGHALYFGLGAYASVLGWIHIKGLSFLSGILLGGAAAGLVGFVLSAFLVRLSGTYFALLTFAFNQLIWGIAWKWRSVTGGDDGLGNFPKPDLFGLSMRDPANFYYITLVIIGLCLLACWYFMRTPLGNSVLSVKSNEERAWFVGFNVNACKVIFLTFLGFLTGVSGAFFAQFHNFICTTVIDMGRSTNVLFMAYLGGIGSFWGPLIGSGVFVYLSEYLSSLTSRWEFLFGLIFIMMAYFAPEGVTGIVQRRAKGVEDGSKG